MAEGDQQTENMLIIEKVIPITTIRLTVFIFQLSFFLLRQSQPNQLAYQTNNVTIARARNISPFGTAVFGVLAHSISTNKKETQETNTIKNRAT